MILVQVPEGKRKSGRAATIDHSIPIAKGGKGGGNLVLACNCCNQKKGDLGAAEFRYRFRKWLDAKRRWVLSPDFADEQEPDHPPTDTSGTKLADLWPAENRITSGT